MPKLIKDRALVEHDPWIVIKGEMSLEELAGDTGQDLIVPLSAWLDHQDALLAREGRIGVWLDSHELPARIGERLHELSVIGLNFPVFSDGRAFSSARELREKFDYRGEIRAMGDVLRDQLFYMARCGFDAFALRDDQDPAECLSAFDDFRDGYQASIDQPLPLFRRRRGNDPA